MFTWGHYGAEMWRIQVKEIECGGGIEGKLNYIRNSKHVVK
jgi:hypothetical protein